MRPGPASAHNFASSDQPLYSPLAVRVVGLVFGPFFGGLLAYQNLRRLGRPAKAWWLLWGGLTLTIALVLVRSLPALRGAGLGLFILTGLWLGDWHERMAPEAGRSPRKSVWKPLFFLLLVVLGLLVMLAALRNY
jgi:hypothetical protein